MMNEALQSVLTSQWSQHPITKQAIEELQAQCAEIVDRCIDSSDGNGVDDKQLRMWLVNAKALRNAIKTLTNQK